MASKKVKTSKVKIVGTENESSNSLSESLTMTDSADSTEQNNEDYANIHNFQNATISIKLPDTKNNIMKTKFDTEYSVNIDYPRFSLGFHHYIHVNKDKMEIVNKFEGKKKVYLVMNKFERYIDDYNDTIDNVCKTYFGLKNKPAILSRGFFKLWEILMTYQIIDINKSGSVFAFLAEGPGSFIQAAMFYRDLFAKEKAKNDKYYAVTLHPEDEDGHVPALEKNFIDFYEKEKPQRFFLHKTFSKQVAGAFADKDNGDITDPKTITLFGGQMNEKADLITGDIGTNWQNENTQEQEAFKLIFAEIVAAIKLQKQGGSFVCKFFETFTTLSIKFLCILKSFYEHVHIIKPLMSRPSNSEKYAVCINFLYNDKQKEYIDSVKKLEDILEQNHKSRLNIIDIFSGFEIDQEFSTTVAYANTEIANTQLLSISDIIKFINSEDYYGDMYLMKRQMQIDASKYWIQTYLPSKDKLKTAHNNLHEIDDNVINNYATDITNLRKKLN
jgi:23S rRNA U2552 (ribose-2'-O)-methylase RlmE/FtsJ